MNSHSGEAAARSMYPLQVSKEALSITAAMNVSNSCTSPTFSEAVYSLSSVSTSGQMLAGMNAREHAEHFWPWNSNEPRTIAAARGLISAVLWAKMKSLPPVSPTRRG